MTEILCHACFFVKRCAYIFFVELEYILEWKLMNHDLLVKAFVRRFHAQIRAYACLVNET